MGLRMSARVIDAMQPPVDRAGRNLAAWSFLAGLLLLAALAGPFFAGRVYTADDLGAFHLPLRAFYAEQLTHGRPYDWMPGLFSGFYLTGEGQAGVYHPVHQILYRFLPLRVALGLEYLLPYPLMMLGTWLLLRRGSVVRRPPRSALVFTFSSFNLLHFVHPNAVAVVAHIPWLLWAIDVVLLDSRRRRVALASALIALLTGSQLLLGYPQYVGFSLLTEISYAAFLLTTHRYAAADRLRLPVYLRQLRRLHDADLAALGDCQGNRSANRRRATPSHARCLAPQHAECRPRGVFRPGDRSIP